jgi:hypothetical protein
MGTLGWLVGLAFPVRNILAESPPHKLYKRHGGSVPLSHNNTCMVIAIFLQLTYPYSMRFLDFSEFVILRLFLNCLVFSQENKSLLKIHLSIKSSFGPS